MPPTVWVRTNIWICIKKTVSIRARIDAFVFHLQNKSKKEVVTSTNLYESFILEELVDRLRELISASVSPIL
jgi:hypothetical protein